MVAALKGKCHIFPLFHRGFAVVRRFTDFQRSLSPQKNDGLHQLVKNFIPAILGNVNILMLQELIEFLRGGVVGVCLRQVGYTFADIGGDLFRPMTETGVIDSGLDQAACLVDFAVIAYLLTEQPDDRLFRHLIDAVSHVGPAARPNGDKSDQRESAQSFPHSAAGDLEHFRKLPLRREPFTGFELTADDLGGKLLHDLFCQSHFVESFELKCHGYSPPRINVKPFTVASYKGQIKNHIKPALGAVRLEELAPHTIQSFYNALGKPKGNKPGLSPKSIKNVHGILHKALQQAVENQYIRFNPADVCKLPRVERKELQPLDEQQIPLFLKAIKSHQFEALYTVTLFTGMREGEALGLRWSCVNFKDGTITIDKQLQQEKKKNGQYVFASLKNGKSRVITPAPWVMDYLNAHRVKQAEARLKAGPVWENSGLVFTDDVGHHLTISTVYKNFKKIVASIGCPNVRFHDLRHSYAVASIRAGDDIKTVQGNLGHATAAFTLDVYGHVTDQMKRASAERMEGFIKDVLGL